MKKFPSSSVYFISFRGPEDTCFEFGVFPAILSFPLDYPLSPPKMRFTCEMFHPNSEYLGSCVSGSRRAQSDCVKGSVSE